MWLEPVPLDQAKQFFFTEKNAGNLPGMLVTDNYFISVYNEGLTEDQITESGQPNERGLNKRRMNPHDANTFEIAESKVADLSEIEDDKIHFIG
ncbi:hypothetical protein [Algoriphagus jejuensis]